MKKQYYKVIKGESTEEHSYSDNVVVFKDYDEATDFIKEYAEKAGFILEVKNHYDDELFYVKGIEFIMIEAIECEAIDLVHEGSVFNEGPNLNKTRESFKSLMLESSEMQMIKKFNEKVISNLEIFQMKHRGIDIKYNLDDIKSVLSNTLFVNELNQYEDLEDEDCLPY